MLVHQSIIELAKHSFVIIVSHKTETQTIADIKLDVVDGKLIVKSANKKI